MPRGDDRIKKYYLFRAVTSFALWIPFWTLWAYENIESLFLLTVVDTAFWMTMVIFQIPAGLLGDKFGRKPMLLLGEICAAAGVLLFGFSADFWQFFLSNIVWAFGVCFIVSGDTPFLYDTLLELGRQKEFISIMAKSWAVMAAMTATACVVGGILVEFLMPGRLDLTLIISSVVCMIGSMTVLLLKEPKVERPIHESYMLQLRVGMNTVLKSRAILVLILFQVVVELAIYVMAVFRSVYMSEDLELNYFWIGAFISTFTICGGVFAYFAGRIEGDLGEKRSLLFLLLVPILAFFVVFMVSSPVAIVVQYPMYMVSSLIGPIISGYINKRVGSSHRSTVVAISSLAFTFALVIVETTAGWIATAWGTRESLMVLALAIAPVGFYLLTIWNKEVDQSKLTARTRTLKKM